MSFNFRASFRFCCDLFSWITNYSSNCGSERVLMICVMTTIRFGSGLINMVSQFLLKQWERYVGLAMHRRFSWRMFWFVIYNVLMFYDLWQAFLLNLKCKLGFFSSCWADISNSLWGNMNQNDISLSFEDGSTPVKACGDLADHMNICGKTCARSTNSACNFSCVSCL